MPVKPATIWISTGTALIVALGAALAFAAPAQAQLKVQPTEVPMSLRLGFETIDLPHGERMGLVGGTLLLQAAPGWWVGPAAYGAASGERGGLFVGGVELQRRFVFGRTQLAAGLFAGGGGGAAAPVGGGLMLRPALTLMQDFGGWQAGLSVSKLRFPSGDIDSNQFGLVVAWDGRFLHADAADIGQAASAGWRSGVGFDCVVGTVGAYDLRFRDQPARRIGLIGTRLERRFGSGTGAANGFDAGALWGLELAAAASGGAAGYMEILGSGGWDVAPLPRQAPSLRVGVRAAVGLGGGGGVPTGGGPIAKASLGLSWQATSLLSTGVEVGVLKALDSRLRAPTAQWWLAVEITPRGAPDGGVRGTTTEREVKLTEWAVALQHHSDVQRVDGSSRSLGTLGLKVNRYVSPNLYLSAQAHTAFAGGAGAYGIGLVGVGLTSAVPLRGWQAGVEALLGASGGGGVDTSSGALAQALLWAGWSPDAGSQWRVGIGGMRSFTGDLSTPVLEAAYVWRFGQP
ncbi:MAG: hypothetical protein ABIN96_14930 [Rubrivivax sp.]